MDSMFNNNNTKLRSRRGKKSKKRKARMGGGTSSFGREPLTHTVTVRLSFQQVVSANAAGNIAVNNNIGSENVFNAPFDGFASFEAVYQEYRVIKLGLKIIRSYTMAPIVVSSIVGGATASAPVNGAGAQNCADYLMVGKTYGANAPSTVAQIRQLDNMTIENVCGDRVLTYEISARDFPNALLWGSTGAVIPVANQIGFVLASSGSGNLPASIANVLLIYSYAIVQFRGRL